MTLFADVGIPMLAIVWPVAWLAFLPVVLIESVVALKSLQLRFGRALLVTAAANAASTLVGIPIAWFFVFVIQIITQVMAGHHSLWHANDTLVQATIAVSTQIAWMGPYGDPGRMVPIAAIFLCVPFYFASVLIEYPVVRRMAPNGHTLRFCWWANFWSYMALALFWVSCLLTSGAASSSPPRTTAEEAAAIASIEKLGGRVFAYDESRDRSAMSVNLSGSQMTDTDLRHLQGLAQRLQWLYLDANITDAGMKQVKRLTNLRELSLDEAKVTDTGLKNLKGLTKLRSLRLYHAKVTDEGVKDLQRALPNCKIER